MDLHAHVDFECQAAAPLVRAALADPGCWPLADQGGRPLWLDDLWIVTSHHDDHGLRWSAQAAATPQRCYATMHLLPAATSTHVRLHVTLLQPDLSLYNPLAYQAARRRLSQHVQSAVQRLQAHWPGADATQGPAQHPLTQAAFATMGASQELERISQLDQRWAALERGTVPQAPHSQSPSLPAADRSYDLVYAGGGLGLIHAALMARQGWRVLVFDRAEVGCAHREWNISQIELERLVATGLVSWAELEREVIMARYADGLVRFHADGGRVPPAEIHLPGVLDVALDAGALLRLARRALEAAGGSVLEGYGFEHVFVAESGHDHVVVAVSNQQERLHLGARLLIDGMGATSPLTLARQQFSGICPTVGTVVSGVASSDPGVGDILISVADTQRDRQLIWEAFPGRGAELTVYLFYYDLVGAQARQRHSLLDLFEDYFALLPTYQAPGADFRHERPLYGYIPARHSVRRMLPLAGVLALGDASAQQSPLTFCGFGSFIRNLGRTTSLLDQALRLNLLQPQSLAWISARQANVAMNWVFSRFMTPWEQPQDVNELQNVFAHVLNRLGPELSRRFFQDQMTWRDYRAIILGTLQYYPAIMGIALKVLGWRDCGRWVADWLRFSQQALICQLARPWLPALIPVIKRLSPAAAFACQAQLAEWQAMGWYSPSS